MFNNMSCCHPHWYADDGFPCWADLSEVTPVLILAWSLRAFCGHIVPRETAGRAVRFWRFVASQQQVVVIIHVAMLRRLRHPCSGASESIRTRTIRFCLWNISKDEKCAVARWVLLSILSSCAVTHIYAIEARLRPRARSCIKSPKLAPLQESVSASASMVMLTLTRVLSRGVSDSKRAMTPSWCYCK